MESKIGFYLGIFTLLSIITVLLTHKKLSTIFNNYYLMSVSGIAFFLYIWIIRYQEDITNLINGTSLINGEFNDLLDKNPGNVKVSKVFLLDLCPFNAMVISMLLTFDRNRVILKIISPYAFLGGTITIFGQIIQEGVGDKNNFYKITSSWDFIFGNEGYFLMHYIPLIYSLIFWLNTKGFGLVGILGTLLFPLLYVSYVMLITTQLKVSQNATGFVEYDLVRGQYWKLGKFFKNMHYRFIIIICYFLVNTYVGLWIFLRNILIIDNKWKHQKMIAFPRISISIQRYINRVKKYISSI